MRNKNKKKPSAESEGRQFQYLPTNSAIEDLLKNQSQNPFVPPKLFHSMHQGYIFMKLHKREATHAGKESIGPHFGRCMRSNLASQKLVFPITELAPVRK
jgi:hypothetical protein